MLAFEPSVETTVTKDVTYTESFSEFAHNWGDWRTSVYATCTSEGKKIRVCNDCGYISKHKLDSCPKCGSKNLDYASRIIGYLKRISRFSEARQREAAKRFYDGKVNI